jgi:hypothetical protein
MHFVEPLYVYGELRFNSLLAVWNNILIIPRKIYGDMFFSNITLLVSFLFSIGY